MRRRGKVYRNSAERREPREKHLIAARHPVPKLEEKKPQQEKQVCTKKTGGKAKWTAINGGSGNTCCRI